MDAWGSSAWIDGATLFAHILGGNLWVSDIAGGGPGDHQIYFWNGSFSSLATTAFFGHHVPPQPHFPYGYDVDPD